MRLVSFLADGRQSFGVVSGSGIVDAGARTAAACTLREALAGDRIGALERLAAAPAVDFGLDEVEYLPTIADPQKIICIGVNYGQRNDEYRDGSSAPAYPSVFMRARESLTGHRQALLRPPESVQLDYEGEIAIVIGRRAHRIRSAGARDHIAGLTLMNEGSVRDWLRHAKFNVTQGKNFLRSGALGPWLVTVDEFSRFDDLRLRTTVNGELRQDDTTANLLFDFGYLLEYLSTFFTLQPGDVIATGTPTGAGARFDPPRYLAPGDTVAVEVEGIGKLENGVADDPVTDG